MLPVSTRKRYVHSMVGWGWAGIGQRAMKPSVLVVAR